MFRRSILAATVFCFTCAPAMADCAWHITGQLVGPDSSPAAYLTVQFNSALAEGTTYSLKVVGQPEAAMWPETTTDAAGFFNVTSKPLADCTKTRAILGSVPGSKAPGVPPFGPFDGPAKDGGTYNLNVGQAVVYH